MVKRLISMYQTFSFSYASALFIISYSSFDHRFLKHVDTGNYVFMLLLLEPTTSCVNFMFDTCYVTHLRHH